MEKYIWINSYNREPMLNRLLVQVLDQVDLSDTRIVVYLDGYNPRRFQQGVGYYYLPHHGKKYYYQLVRRNFLNLKPARYYFKIDDDMQIEDDFFDRAIESWESISDPSKLFLNLLRDHRDDMWGSGPTEDYNGLVRRSGWTDLNFMAGGLMYAHRYDFKFQPPPERITSSGVGRQLTRFGRRIGNMYQVNRSLLIHDDHESQMNPNRGEKLTNV